MSGEMRMDDLERMAAADPDAIVGKRTKPSSGANKKPPSLREWVETMDENKKWPEFEKRVKKFAKEFNMPRTRAVICILFLTGDDSQKKENP